jgi:hypothetical protein
MTDTAVRLTPQLRRRLATGYTVDASGVASPAPYRTITIPAAGAVHSTIDDMTRYVHWLATGLRDERPEVLSARVLADMFDRHFEPDTRLPGYGLGISREDLDGHRIVAHDGGWPGFVTSMFVAPDRGCGVVVWANAFDLTPRRIAESLLAAERGIPSPRDRVRAMPVVVPRRPIADFCGSYTPAGGRNSTLRWVEEYGATVRVEARANTLVLRTGRGAFASGVTLRPGGPGDDLYWVGAAERKGAPLFVRVRFETSRGRIVGMRAGFGAPVDLVRRHRWRHRPLTWGAFNALKAIERRRGR